MPMKKFIISLSVIAGLFTFNALTNDANAEIKIVESNGFQVLDDNSNKDDETTVVCQAVPNEKYGIKTDKYSKLTCINVFDDADFIVLTPQQAKDVDYGDVVLVTFDGDHIIGVHQNTLNIDGKVFGQRIK